MSALWSKADIHFSRANIIKSLNSRPAKGPMSRQTAAKDLERVSLSLHRRAVGRRDRYLDVVADIGPIAEHLKFANITRSRQTDFFHCFRSGAEFLFPKRLTARRHKDHIIRHQAQYGV